jgi:hypothetical protein
MCLQKLTTAEPDNKQIETAAAAFLEVIDHETKHNHDPSLRRVYRRLAGQTKKHKQTTRKQSLQAWERLPITYTNQRRLKRHRLLKKASVRNALLLQNSVT